MHLNTIYQPLKSVTAFMKIPWGVYVECQQINRLSHPSCTFLVLPKLSFIGIVVCSCEHITVINRHPSFVLGRDTKVRLPLCIEGSKKTLTGAHMRQVQDIWSSEIWTHICQVSQCQKIGSSQPKFRAGVIICSQLRFVCHCTQRTVISLQYCTGFVFNL